MIEPLWSSSTPRILRSIGSSILILCFSRSMAFNSSRVVSMKTSRVMTSPCNVFNLSSRDMAGHTETLQISVQFLYLKNGSKRKKYGKIANIWAFFGNVHLANRKFGYVSWIWLILWGASHQLQVGMSFFFICRDCFAKNLEQRKHSKRSDGGTPKIHAPAPNNCWHFLGIRKRVSNVFWVDYRRLIQLNPLTELLRETTQQVLSSNWCLNRYSNRKWIIWRSLSLL